MASPPAECLFIEEPKFRFWDQKYAFDAFYFHVYREHFGLGCYAAKYFSPTFYIIHY